MSKKGGAGETLDLSVEESNKLRAELGIKPLVEKGKTDPLGSSKNPVDVHAKAAIDSSKGPSESELKRRSAAVRNKKDHEDLTSGEGLGDILKREEAGRGNAAEWIANTRNADGSMKSQGLAAVSAVASSDSKKRKVRDTDGDIPAMKVRHDAKDLEDGNEITMVLSDKPILTADGAIDDSRDELSNVKLVDTERAKHNEEVRKQVEYDPTKEGQDILEKYNDLKTGPKGFLIGGTTMGTIEETDPEKKLSILMALSDRQSLESKHKLQTDFYTAEEMNKFRKPPKKKTKRRKDDKTADKDDHIGGAAPTGTALAGRPADAGSDEEDPELYEQLSKQRRLVRRSDAGSVKKGEAALAAICERIQGIDADLPKGADELEKTTSAVSKTGAKEPGENIAMTATTEFCNVVQTPLEKEDTLKHESFRGSTLYKKQAAQRKGLKMRSRAHLATAAVADADVSANTGDREEEISNLIEESLDLSCASGLAYLRARSQIGGDQDSHKNRKSDNRPLEMSTLDGDIKLEYRDDFGRVQTPKEAFRAISWKFHGKVPGRKNMERRLLRLENEMRLKAMDPINELPTLRALRHVQTSDAKPYMVLSGANEK
eukprot:TRINITY_DN45399_c0_g1_i1.p1 TRINITY_DN45399_c0_g1~~TRINITY_DN45399_c0_g1_i1.p1  ORF type:complete len:602 (+),score=145.11 TRINITY_DN45399_c0_g1_i1:252-2057(+)